MIRHIIIIDDDDFVGIVLGMRSRVAGQFLNSFI